MGAPFDPYHKWLGIPPDEQPPDHYRLLGIELFETDPDVISNSADQRMLHIRSFQNGPQRDASQKILNQISAARVCLLSAPRRSEYDAQLRKQLAERLGPPAVGPPPLLARPVIAPIAKPVELPSRDLADATPQELLKVMLRERVIDPIKVSLETFSPPPWLLGLIAVLIFALLAWAFWGLLHLFDQTAVSPGSKS